MCRATPPLLKRLYTCIRSEWYVIFIRTKASMDYSFVPNGIGTIKVHGNIIIVIIYKENIIKQNEPRQLHASD